MRRRLRLGCLGLLVPAIALPGMLSGQEAGGRRLSIDLSQRIEAESNRNLREDGGDTSLLATTDLNLGFESVTRLSSLGLNFGGDIRAPLSGPGDYAFEGPTTRLNYDRRGANASLSFSARYDEDDIAYLEPLDLVELEDGEVLLPEELDQLEGDGTRENLVLSLSGSWGDARRFGLAPSVTVRRTTYGDGADAGLEDRTGVDADLVARFDLRSDLQATTTLRYNFAEAETDTETDADETKTYGLGLGLAYSRPTGVYNGGLALSQREGDDDLRVALLAGASRRLPGDRSLDFELGLTRAANGETVLTGSADYAARLTPTSGFTVSARRSVFDDVDENEIVTTALDANYNQELTRLTDLSLGMGLVGRNDLDSDERTTDVSLTARVSRDLTRDWSISAGVSAQFRDSDTDGSANSETVFFEIGRSFLTKF